MIDVSDRLPVWLRDINLEPGADRQQAISDAATALSQYTGRDAWDIVLLAHGLESGQALDHVASEIRAQDGTWDIRSGDLEAVLTAAVAVAIGLQSAPKFATPLGLAVQSARFSGLASPIQELPNLARTGLMDASETLRARRPFALPAADIKGAMAEAGDFTQPVGIDAAVIQQVVTAAEKAATRAAATSGRLATAINTRLAATEEELNLLWWAFGESSDLLEKPFRALPVAAVGLVAGVELARYYTLDCPLPSTRSLLSRLLAARSDKPNTIAQAVPAAQKRLAAQWAPSLEGHRLLPVTSSAAEYVELSGKPAWCDSVSRWGIDPRSDTTNLALAEQMVYETLLVRYDDA